MTPETPARNTLSLDVDAYEHFLAETGWSDAEKAEYLGALWAIISQFVGFGFGVHPVQQGERGCGQLGKSFAIARSGEIDVVELEHPNLDIFRGQDARDTQKEAP